MTKAELIEKLTDLGEKCVVKIELGQYRKIWNTLWRSGHDHESTLMFNKTFEQVRTAIEGEPPVPRVERRKTKSTATGDNVYLLFVDDEERRGVEHSQIT